MVNPGDDPRSYESLASCNVTLKTIGLGTYMYSRAAMHIAHHCEV